MESTSAPPRAVVPSQPKRSSFDLEVAGERAGEEGVSLMVERNDDGVETGERNAERTRGARIASVESSVSRR